MPPRINIADFSLAPTLESGQAFRWSRAADGWFVGVVGCQVWRLRQQGDQLEWEAHPENPEPTPGPSGGGESPPGRGWGGSADESPQTFLRRYLSLDVSLPAVVATFPDDAALRSAVDKHWGLRVLRQEPWETLVSFIASSSKQIVQIRQIVAHLAARFGEPIETPGGVYHAFPRQESIARATHQELWECKLGFRAKNLLASARLIDRGAVRLDALAGMEHGRALEELRKLPGVGEKIANCTLLFSCGFDDAFPIDVWMERSLRRLYFPRRRVTARHLRQFTRSNFGPYAGWAQQYLFFDERLRGRAARSELGSTESRPPGPQTRDVEGDAASSP